MSVSTSVDSDDGGGDDRGDEQANAVAEGGMITECPAVLGLCWAAKRIASVLPMLHPLSQSISKPKVHRLFFLLLPHEPIHQKNTDTYDVPRPLRAGSRGTASACAMRGAPVFWLATKRPTAR